MKSPKGILGPVSGMRPSSLAWLGFLAATIAVGGWAYLIQFTTGLIVTDMRNVAIWGLYMVNFIFFIGLSAGGIIIAASTYVFGAERYKPVSRLAAFLAAVSVAVAVFSIIADMGRPERALNLFFFAKLESPLIWDLIVISSYLGISMVDVWFMCRADFVRKGSFLAFGSKDISDESIKRDKKIVKAISFVALPTAVLLHSVTAWIFGLQIARPWWNSALLAPVFLASAIVSGLALLIVTALAATRLNLIRVEAGVFRDLAKLLAAIVPIDFFLKFTEVLSRLWPASPVELEPLMLVLTGPYSLLFIVEWTIGGIVPFIILVYPKTRNNLKAIALSAVLLVIGVFAYRIEILMPGLVQPLFSPPPGQSLGQYIPGVGSYTLLGTYFPTWIEIAVTAALIATGALVVTLALRIVPFTVESKQTGHG
jgi:molybdopterin-containing oxidoreductase family membrane subunit